ncbi:MAG: hypothetical protein QG622_2668 [Actinomycetota bacterium]|nr:hypothetical protein [Actinomycetota bacterium]
MTKIDWRIFSLCWIGFTLFFLVLQYFFNRATSAFVVAVSALGAIPVALIIAFQAMRRMKG